ncbi:MAG TPA: hypothetical protein VFM02_04010 [Candidatus Paceibacterota bacterium]|nr:hypothetical protein [Candidatus Paceibacterota bacterium]
MYLSFIVAAKRSLVITLALSFLGLASFFLFEPSITKAATDSVTVSQAVTADISLSAASDITLSALSSSVNSAVGSTTWTVITNNSSGYNLKVAAGTSPALKSGSNSFADYSEAVAGTPETWSVSNAYEFGFSGFGTDVSTASFGSDTKCTPTANDPSASSLKWEGFDTTGIELANSSGVTNTSGSDVTLCVATEQNGVFAPSGSYSATITATAVVNP